jgi:hypothetical protein
VRGFGDQREHDRMLVRGRRLLLNRRGKFGHSRQAKGETQAKSAADVVSAADHDQ